MGDLSNLNYADVIGGVIKAIDVLFGEEEGDAGLIDAEIPFINKSLNDMLGLERLRSAIVGLRADGAKTLDSIKTAIDSVLSEIFKPGYNLSVIFEPIKEAGETGPTKMKVAIAATNLNITRTERVDVTDADLAEALGFDLGPLSFAAGADATVDATANLALDLAFGIDADTGEFDVFVGDGSGFGVVVNDISLAPEGTTSIDLGFAEGSVSIGAGATIGLDAGTMTVEGLDGDFSALVGRTF